MRRAQLLGLRGRLTAALVLISALTLAVAAGTLLLPLDRRLRDDALESLTQTALAARPTFADLPGESIRPGAASLARASVSLGRQTGAEVAVVDLRGGVLAASSAETDHSFGAALAALRRDAPVRDITGRGEDAEVEVAIPVEADGVRFALALRRPLDAALSAGAVVRRGLLVALPAAMALALLAGVLLAGRLVRRLNALRDTALRLADLGATAEVRPDSARDEVGDLTRAFATMQQQLREQEQARRTFVATASHELRTPVASLQLLLELLAEDLAPDGADLPSARDQVDRARTQSRRLGVLAAELLDLSRLDAGLPLREELVELTGLSRSVIAEFEPRADERGVALELEAPGRAWAIADPGSVAQVLRIVIDNALRVGPPGAPIALRVHAAEDGAPAISIHDDGPGVPRTERERIFERFQRGTDTAGESGFGLGLAIGRELARRMGGDLRLADAVKGATFVITLSAAPAGLLEGGAGLSS